MGRPVPVRDLEAIYRKRDWTSTGAYARDAIDVGEYLRARAVPERPVVTLAAKLVVWAIAAATGAYCIAIWVGVAS